MAGLAEKILKWLDMAGIAENGWKGLDIAGNGCKLLERAGRTENG